MSWRLAEMLGVGNLRVLQPSETGDGAGFGVVGELPEAVDDRGVHADHPTAA